MRTILSRTLIAAIAVGPLVMGQDVRSLETRVGSLSVDMPHGGCSLTLRRDGQASIHYGAMPRWVRVTPGTFDFKQILALLHVKSYAQSERPSHKGAVGSVSLPEFEAVRFIDDGPLVRSLLEQAWKARVVLGEHSDQEDYRWVARACSFSHESEPYK